MQAARAVLQCSPGCAGHPVGSFQLKAVGVYACYSAGRRKRGAAACLLYCKSSSRLLSCRLLFLGPDGDGWSRQWYRGCTQWGCSTAQSLCCRQSPALLPASMRSPGSAQAAVSGGRAKYAGECMRSKQKVREAGGL